MVWEELLKILLLLTILYSLKNVYETMKEVKIRISLTLKLCEDALIRKDEDIMQEQLEDEKQLQIKENVLMYKVVAVNSVVNVVAYNVANEIFMYFLVATSFVILNEFLKYKKTNKCIDILHQNISKIQNLKS